MPQPSNRAPDSFKSRALAEAARYGSDRWVFVRELLQNSRDAGARIVELRSHLPCGESGAALTITCLDDGDGMSFDDARRYLFALYSSSKDGHPEQAGKFGIGFWSVLRFEPSTIIVRSRVAGREAWRATLDGNLSTVTIEERVQFPHQSGTEVTLTSTSERALQDADPTSSLFGAARLYGRFLTRRDTLSEVLTISVDGRNANRPFALEPPCASFEDRELRGVVGLAREPLVELFAQGLFVRATPSIRDLAAEDAPHASQRTEEALASVPSLAPRLILDGRNLDLLLARSDARQDRAMSRLVRRSEKELRRLLRDQLRAIRPEPWFRPWLGRASERLRPLAVPSSSALLGGALLGALLWWWSPPSSDPFSLGPDPILDIAAESTESHPTVETAPAVDPSEPDLARSSSEARFREPDLVATLQSALQEQEASAGHTDLLAQGGPSHSPLHLYSDLSQSYSGPSAPGLGTIASAVALRYTPATAPILFNALVVSRELGWSWTEGLRQQPTSGPYREGICEGNDCLSIELAIEPKPGLLRLPVPTGHVLETGSVELDGRTLRPRSTSQGEPIVELLRDSSTTKPRSPAVLRYRTVPGPAQPGSQGSFEPQPELDEYARQIRELPETERPAAAVELISRRIVYDRSAQTPTQTQLEGFLDWALEERRGDCDVQNAVLTDLLRRIGIRSRLVVGYVGRGGVAEPGLHAWVEAELDGSWHTLDASLAAPSENAPLPAAPPFSPTRIPSPWGWMLAAGLTALLGGLGVAGSRLIRNRRAASVQLGSTAQLAPILGGALRHPRAFADLPALFHGRFIPRLESSKAISLHTAKKLADEGGLFCSRSGSKLARAAIHNGVIVVDAATEEGAIASSVLGAIEIDEWSAYLDSRRESSLADELNLVLAELGEDWRVYSAEKLPQPLIEVDLQALKTGPRAVLFDASHSRFAWTEHDLPASSLAFTLAAELVELLDLEARPRARILSALGGNAIAEAFGR